MVEIWQLNNLGLPAGKNRVLLNAALARNIRQRLAFSVFEKNKDMVDMYGCGFLSRELAPFSGG